MKRTRAAIREYQRQYYLLCIAVDQDGMRQQWRESKRKKKGKFQSMTHYRIEMVLTCPSDWTQESARRYIEKFVLTEEERITIQVAQPGDTPTQAEHYRAALVKIRHIKKAIPFDAADAATECISIAKKALGII